MTELLIPVILSGGAGTRLWPVSRRSYPKPFMRMGDGESLLEKTLNRALAVSAADTPIITVTARDYFFVTRDEYARVTPAALPRMRYVLEPLGRNTAAAVIGAALLARETHGDDATLLILPADHLVRDIAVFAQAVDQARSLAAQGQLVTFGVVPTRPETGYGYVRRGQALGTAGFEVQRFVEKPELATARAYVESGEYLWNSGMFCFRVGTVLAVAAETCADVLSATQAAFAAARRDGASVELPRDEFARVPDISVDYAIMERAKARAVVPATFDWSDIGSWVAVGEQGACDERGNIAQGDAVLVDSHDTYVRAETRTVAVVGVSDLTVVETRDAVLVAHRGAAQDVKRVVDALRARQHPVADTHMTVHRPWGSYTVLEDAPDCKVKRLVVKPGQVLSLQLHHKRSEHWTVVQGTAKVRVGEREFLLEQNQSTYIPMGTVHRLENPTERDIALIEVQCGEYFGEDDIVRLEDRYGRVGK